VYRRVRAFVPLNFGIPVQVSRLRRFLLALATAHARTHRPSVSSAPVPRTHNISSFLLINYALCTKLDRTWPALAHSGFMAMHLLRGRLLLDEESVGTYAGLIAAAFMTGRAVSAYGWGKVADTYGRVPVLQASLALSALFTLFFGMSTNYYEALT